MNELPSVKPVARRASLRDTVTRALRAAIISGEMIPGNIYSAPMLSQRFGVSATPVREAMLDLVKEGLMVSVPNKGFQVTEVSEDDLDKLASIRMLIEPPTIAQVTPNIPIEDLAELRDLADKIVKAAREQDLIGYVDNDREFHLALLAYSGNERLVNIVSELRAQTRLTGLQPLVEAGELVDSASEHLELLDLIESRDATAAEELMRKHIGHVRGLWAGADKKPAA